MKRSWTALAVALLPIFAVAGCNDYGNTFQGNTGAVITSLSPSRISAGNSDFTFTVTGSGFVTGTVVRCNGSPLKTTHTPNSAGNILNDTAILPMPLLTQPTITTII